MATTSAHPSTSRDPHPKTTNILYWIIAFVIVGGLVWFLAFKNVPNTPAPTIDQPAGAPLTTDKN